MAVFVLLVAVFANHQVESIVWLHIIDASKITVVAALVIIIAAFLLTKVSTTRKVPT